MFGNWDTFEEVLYRLSHTNVHELLGPLSGAIIVLIMAIALIFIYYGYKAHLTLIQVFGFVSGFFAGGILGYGFISNTSSQVLGILIPILVGFFCGTLAAGLALIINFMLVFLAGAGGGSIIVGGIMGVEQIRLDEPLILLGGVLGGFLALGIYKLVYVVLTSFTGSVMLVAVIAGDSFAHVLNQYSIGWLSGNYQFFWLFFISGTIVQLGTIYFVFDEKFISKYRRYRKESPEDKLPDFIRESD